MNTIKQIPTAQLAPHPKNPRLVMREDVIESIRAGLKNGFLECYALQVWPQGDSFIVLSGHHRLEAAKREGIAEVPCFVRDELDEEAAYMVLATANAQGELSPLEIGMHALHYVAKAKGGRGQKGGLSGYADSIGADESFVRRMKNAAQVLQNIGLESEVFKDKETGKIKPIGNHLAEIYKLPEQSRKTAAEKMGTRSAKDVAAWVSTTLEAIKQAEPMTATGKWFSEGDLALAILRDEVTSATIRRLVGIYDEITGFIAKHEIQAEELDALLESKSTNPRDFSECMQELMRKQFAAEDKSQWLQGDWADHLDTIEDDSVSLMLTDPPYGMEYQSNHRKERHEKIVGDDSTAAFEDALAAFMPKLRADAHVLAFVNWRNEARFIAACEQAGLTVKSSLVWVKNNTSMGDLEGSFAPKHERIIHAVKGKPKLFSRAPDVMECARVDTKRHPTEKPVALLRSLIDACTVKGQLVADPFGGVGSVPVAAKQLGRDYWGCEISTKYHAEGAVRLDR